MIYYIRVPALLRSNSKLVPFCPPVFALFFQTSKIHGHGVFANKRLSAGGGTFLKMPLEGSFEVYDSVDDSVEATKDDGLPRFLLSDNMALFLSEGEVARPNAGLYIVPAKTSPLFYVNSSRTPEHKADETLTFMPVLMARSFRGVEDKRAYLRNAMNSVMFDIARDVEKDVELLASYTFQEPRGGE